ncbi:MAG TPA: ABC transporter substrate-binding protein [Blastocatellia bacterium]|nr:ABC transporter substrate-binding protein [Blastocatellia bacterium]
MKMHKSIVAAIAAAVLVASAACKNGGAPGSSGVANPPFRGDPPQDAYVYQGEPGVYGGQLVLSLPSEMKTFNVIAAVESSSNDVLWYHVFRCLVDFRNGDNPPAYDSGVCTSYEKSADAKQWTFHLRRGVRWSDGEPFTADDVLFTYDVIRDKNVQTDIAAIFDEGKDANGETIYPELKKLDDYTVQFNLHEPKGGFLDMAFNLWLIPKHKWEASWRAGKFNEQMQVSSDPNEMVGLGPYRIKEYVAGQRVVLERNPYFWKVDKKGQRLPYLDRIIFVFARSFDTILAKFQAGDIDGMSRVLADQFALVKRMESPDIKVEDIGVTYDTNWMVLNQHTGTNKTNGKPFVVPWKLRLFRNQKFRQAVSYAIDREGIANTIYSARAEPLFTFVTSGDNYWYSDDIMKYPHDPARARQLLSEIGLADMNGDGLLEDSEGHTVEFNISPNAENAQRTNVAAFISNNLKEVGIKANVAPAAINVISTMLRSTFEYEAIILGWQTGVPPGPINTKNILLSAADSHPGFPSQQTPSTEWESRIDDLVKKIDASPDEAERKRLFAEIQRIWSEQMAEINLVAQKEGVAYRTKFGNLRPCSLPPRLTWNCEEIYLKSR